MCINFRQDDHFTLKTNSLLALMILLLFTSSASWASAVSGASEVQSKILFHTPVVMGEVNCQRILEKKLEYNNEQNSEEFRATLNVLTKHFAHEGGRYVDYFPKLLKIIEKVDRVLHEPIQIKKYRAYREPVVIERAHPVLISNLQSKVNRLKQSRVEIAELISEEKSDFLSASHIELLKQYFKNINVWIQKYEVYIYKLNNENDVHLNINKLEREARILFSQSWMLNIKNLIIALLPEVSKWEIRPNLDLNLTIVHFFSGTIHGHILSAPLKESLDYSGAQHKILNELINRAKQLRRAGRIPLLISVYPLPAEMLKQLKPYYGDSILIFLDNFI